MLLGPLDLLTTFETQAEKVGSQFVTSAEKQVISTASGAAQSGLSYLPAPVANVVQQFIPGTVAAVSSLVPGMDPAMAQLLYEESISGADAASDMTTWTDVQVQAAAGANVSTLPVDAQLAANAVKAAAALEWERRVVLWRKVNTPVIFGLSATKLAFGSAVLALGLGVWAARRR